MKVIQILILLILIVLASLVAINLYKFYSWDRTDIINIATLTTAVVTIFAIVFNAMQYSVAKNSKLYELGEFRIEKVYKPKLERIQRLKIILSVNENVINKGRGFQLEPNNLHIVQHHLVEYLRKTYQDEIPLNILYFPSDSNRNDKTFKEFVKVLKDFYEGINQYSPWVFNYHKQHLDLINEIRKDNKMLEDQKESFISSLLFNDMLGYNMIMTGKASNNFNIVNGLSDEEQLKISTTGYLDFIKSILPSEDLYLSSLGKYAKLFIKDIPK